MSNQQSQSTLQRKEAEPPLRILHPIILVFQRKMMIEKLTTRATENAATQKVQTTNQDTEIVSEVTLLKRRIEERVRKREPE